MSRIISIDYGMKRTGIAVTDPLQIIASALTSIDSARIFTFLEEYLKREPVELILIGDPHNLDGSPTDLTDDVHRIIGILGKKFPHIPVKRIDERYSSVMASRAMVEMGMKKKNRRGKGDCRPGCRHYDAAGVSLKIRRLKPGGLPLYVIWT